MEIYAQINYKLLEKNRSIANVSFFLLELTANENILINLSGEVEMLNCSPIYTKLVLKLINL